MDDHEDQLAKALHQLIRPEPGPAHLEYEVMEQYVDGRLDAVDLQIVEGHLTICKQCTDEVVALRSVAASFSGLPGLPDLRARGAEKFGEVSEKLPQKLKLD